jgi:signal transduction histidine kinase
MQLFWSSCTGVVLDFIVDSAVTNDWTDGAQLDAGLGWDVLRTSSNPIWVVTQSGEILWFNDAASTYLALEGRSRPGKLFDRLPRDKAQHRRLMLNEVRRSGKDVEFVDFHQNWWQVSIRATKQPDVFVFWQRDIGQQIAAEEGLRQSLIRAVTIQEDERRRISRDLHDETGQAITGLILELRELSRRVIDPDLRQKADRAAAAATTLMKLTRGILHQLNPPSLKSRSLATAISEYCSLFSERTGIEVVLEAALPPVPLSDDRATTLFRLLQESLTNVARHSNATTAWVSLAAEDNEVTISVEDDGVGFIGDAVEGNGLRGIRERFAMLDGHVEIDGAKGRGVRIEGSIPVKMGRVRGDREDKGNDSHSDRG